MHHLSFNSNRPCFLLNKHLNVRWLIRWKASGSNVPRTRRSAGGLRDHRAFVGHAFDDARVTSAIEATGRKKLIFAGISLEVCAALPAITAVGKIGRASCREGGEKR